MADWSGYSQPHAMDMDANQNIVILFYQFQIQVIGGVRQFYTLNNKFSGDDAVYFQYYGSLGQKWLKYYPDNNCKTVQTIQFAQSDGQAQRLSIVQALWSQKYEGNTVQELYTTIFVNESSQKLYVGFVQKYNQDAFTNVAKIGVIRVNSSNGQQDWSYGFQYNRVTVQDQYIQIQDIKVKTIDSKDYIGVCSNTIYGNFDFWETRVVFSLLITDDTTQTKEMRSFEYPEYLRGRDFKIVSPTEFYVIVISSLPNDIGDPLYIFRISDIKSNGATITKTKIIFMHTFTLTDALFLDNYKAIYLASAYNYKLILLNKYYTQLLNSNDYQRSCAENNTADEVTTEFKQFSTLYQYASFTNNLTQGNLKFILNGTLKMVDMNIETYYVPYGKFCVPKVSIIATQPTVTHYVQQGPFKLDLNQYISGDDICEDKRRNFSKGGYFGISPFSIFNNTAIVLSSQQMTGFVKEPLVVNVEYPDSQKLQFTVYVDLKNCYQWQYVSKFFFYKIGADTLVLDLLEFYTSKDVN
ncbi:UNKNOWN [Stylonychia lemnae]|uniref:Uncharacterized protein n=1 Tax=Stylonychia lemnae TaxID=5949 RepID=A0A077ZSN9_STYLE|nr:UNKNOWN [Stylonychia lemnae]|eukprot:CDW72579.1 UNKNOWN [Stylonychia lemnae]